VAKDALTSTELFASLARGTVAPVYLLYGEEDLLVEEALDAILQAALEGGDRTFNLDVLGAGETDGREIAAAASSFPMAGGRRVVVVREADKLSLHDCELLAAYVAEPSPSTCLILVAVKPDMRKKPYAAIKRSGGALECKRLYEDKIPSWIAGAVMKGGYRIEAEAAKLLAAYVGTSLREIRSELVKLYIYIGDRKEITAGDVSALVGMSKEFSPFELQKVVGRRETARAMRILEEILGAGGGAPLVIATMTNYFLTLWKLHDLQRRGIAQKDQAAQARVHPFFIQEYHEALGFQPPAACERALLLLAEADEQSKSGTYDVRQVMESLIVRLCGAEERNIGRAPVV
jgi:DNA polymerase-3 subunit delta